ncbi:MAG: Crp/Fnr family transcriptional regulator [Hahellaceae bacterium]|nr:Crp/Fnr family transcriptional regulator [Hahellaceae bacterium]MCP5211027.1 Crp/Fnr family transcriptional regulator [Hahellaceae bacterium]
MQTPNDIANILKTGAWFSNLPEEMQSMLLAAGKKTPLLCGQKLFARGDAPCGIYAVLDGCVRVTGVASNGKEAILTLIEPAQWFGEIALFDGNARTHDAVAEVDSVLWHIPQNTLINLLDEQPAYWRPLGQLLTFKLRMAFQAIEDIALLPAPLRLARRLLILAAANDSKAAPDTIAQKTLLLPQEVLGLMLGISRQTTNQILRDLEQQGLISLQRSKICILDQAALRIYAYQ